MNNDQAQHGTSPYLDAVILHAHQVQQMGEQSQQQSQEEIILQLFAEKDALLTKKDAVIAAFQIASHRAVRESRIRSNSVSLLYTLTSSLCIHITVVYKSL